MRNPTPLSCGASSGGSGCDPLVAMMEPSDLW
jgi:hypothetical protein